MIPQAKVQIPLLADGMTHGVLLRWMVGSGDRVMIGQVIFELKAVGEIFEIECLDSGTITTTGMEGESYEIGATIGFVEFTE